MSDPIARADRARSSQGARTRAATVPVPEPSGGLAAVLLEGERLLEALDVRSWALFLGTREAGSVVMAAGFDPKEVLELAADGPREMTPGARRTQAGSIRIVRSLPAHGEPLGWVVLELPSPPEGALSEVRLAAALSIFHAVLVVEAASREEEARTRVTDTVLAEFTTGLIAVDASGRVALVNGPARDLLGTAASELLGRPVTEILRLVARDGTPFPILLDGAPRAGEALLVATDGAEIPVQVRIRPTANGGEAAGSAILLSDLSEERRLQDEMRRKDRLASLGALSAGVAHEIRNPLSGIGTCAQVLRNRLGPGDERVRFTEVILEEVARLDRIVESLLSFASPAAPVLRDARIERPIDRALALLDGELTERGIEVVRRIQPGIPDLWIDPDQMEQVLLNLMQNAVQAMEGGGRLTVSARLARKPSHLRRAAGRRRSDAAAVAPPPAVIEYVEVRVEDTGQGIPPERLTRIFDPFFTTRPKGTGLGLSISQAIVREHLGTIVIDSRVGTGTIATVDLPVERRRGERRAGK